MTRSICALAVFGSLLAGAPVTSHEADVFTRSVEQVAPLETSGDGPAQTAEPERDGAQAWVDDREGRSWRGGGRPDRMNRVDINLAQAKLRLERDQDRLQVLLAPSDHRFRNWQEWEELRKRTDRLILVVARDARRVRSRQEMLDARPS